MEEIILKVSTKSDPNSVAGCIAGLIREKGNATIQVIGAGALNQAMKAICIARGFVAPIGVNLVCIPSFADVELGEFPDESRTALKLYVRGDR